LAQTRIQRKTDAPFFIDKMPNNLRTSTSFNWRCRQRKLSMHGAIRWGAAFQGSSNTLRAARVSLTAWRTIGRYYRDYVELNVFF